MGCRRGQIIAAIIVLICFCLPWIQVSCGATRETASGVDLARDGTPELWLIPLAMFGVLLIGSAKVWKGRHSIAALVNLVCGLVTAYLMNRERLKFEDGAGLIRVGFAPWFWLGLGAAVAIIILAVLDFLKRRRSSETS